MPHLEIFLMLHPDFRIHKAKIDNGEQVRGFLSWTVIRFAVYSSKTRVWIRLLEMIEDQQAN